MYTPGWKHVGLMMMALSAWPAGATTMYTIQDLGVVAGGYVSNGHGINASGQVTGQSSVSIALGRGETYPFFWNGGTMQNLGTLGRGWGINASGQGVGDSLGTGFFWNGTLIEALPTTGYSGVSGTSARGINNSGQVVGTIFSSSDNRTTDNHAVIWSGGIIQDVGVGFGMAINSSGQATGRNSLSNRAFFWDGTTSRELGTLGGNTAFASSVGNAINAFGKIAGVATNALNAQHAFVWDGTNMRDLGTIDGFGSSIGYGINASGGVVGSSDTTTGVRHAFIWDGNTMTDLNSILLNGMGWVLESAEAINDAGQITGTAVRRDNGILTIHAFLLDPVSDGVPPAAEVPESSSIWMAAVGLGVVVMSRRRR